MSVTAVPVWHHMSISARSSGSAILVCTDVQIAQKSCLKMSSLYSLLSSFLYRKCYEKESCLLGLVSCISSQALFHTNTKTKVSSLATCQNTHMPSTTSSLLQPSLQHRTLACLGWMTQIMLRRLQYCQRRGRRGDWPRPQRSSHPRVRLWPRMHCHWQLHWLSMTMHTIYMTVRYLLHFSYHFLNKSSRPQLGDSWQSDNRGGDTRDVDLNASSKDMCSTYLVYFLQVPLDSLLS